MMLMLASMVPIYWQSQRRARRGSVEWWERRMANTLIGLIAVCAAWAIGSAASDAAEIRVDPSGGRVQRAILEGRIESGDFEKFIDFVFNRENAVEIYLASPGGNLGEAMRIGMAIRQLNLSTIVP